MNSYQHWQSTAASIESAQLLMGDAEITMDQSFYINPHIFKVESNTLSIVHKEVFGPVLSVSTFNSMDEAISLANDGKYALAAAVWTGNLKKGHKTAASGNGLDQRLGRRCDYALWRDKTVL